MVSKKEPKTKSKATVVNTEWPMVTKGSHLTVYTYEDGSTRLEWDDNALLKEVQEAIASVGAPKRGKKKEKS